jgi:cell division protein FtsB
MNKGKRSPLLVFALLVIFLYLSYIAVNQQQVLNAKNLTLDKLEDKIEEEAKLNEKLSKERDMIQSDEYVEKVARERLGMVKKNERVYMDIGK